MLVSLLDCSPHPTRACTPPKHIRTRPPHNGVGPPAEDGMRNVFAQEGLEREPGDKNEQHGGGCSTGSTRRQERASSTAETVKNVQHSGGCSPAAETLRHDRGRGDTAARGRSTAAETLLHGGGCSPAAETRAARRRPRRHVRHSGGRRDTAARRRISSTAETVKNDQQSDSSPRTLRIRPPVIRCPLLKLGARVLSC